LYFILKYKKTKKIKMALYVDSDGIHTTPNNYCTMFFSLNPWTGVYNPYFPSFDFVKESNELIVYDPINKKKKYKYYPSDKQNYKEFCSLYKIIYRRTGCQYDIDNIYGQLEPIKKKK
jgi:hypothetical protein